MPRLRYRRAVFSASSRSRTTTSFSRARRWKTSSQSGISARSRSTSGRVDVPAGAGWTVTGCADMATPVVCRGARRRCSARPRPFQTITAANGWEAEKRRIAMTRNAASGVRAHHRPAPVVYCGRSTARSSHGPVAVQDRSDSHMSFPAPLDLEHALSSQGGLTAGTVGWPMMGPQRRPAGDRLALVRLSTGILERRCLDDHLTATSGDVFLLSYPNVPYRLRSSCGAAGDVIVLNAPRPRVASLTPASAEGAQQCRDVIDYVLHGVFAN